MKHLSDWYSLSMLWDLLGQSTIIHSQELISEGLQRSNRAVGAKGGAETEDPWNNYIRDFKWGWLWLDSTPNPFFFLLCAALFFSFCRWWAPSAWWWSRRWSCTRVSTPKRGRTTLQRGIVFSAQVPTQTQFSTCYMLVNATTGLQQSSASDWFYFTEF